LGFVVSFQEYIGAEIVIFLCCGDVEIGEGVEVVVSRTNDDLYQEFMVLSPLH
jgi:hypothetical protein